MTPSDPLQLLRHQYFALVPARLLLLPSSTALANPNGQDYLVQRVLDEKSIPQPENTYRRNFWRVVVRHLEDGLCELQRDAEERRGGEEWDEEIEERFYEVLAGLMVDVNADLPSEPKQSHRTFIYCHPRSPELERYITLLEEQTVLQGGTTGLRTWTAALHLGHHLLHDTAALIPPTSGGSPLRVLELGAGTGFLSCLLAQQGLEVLATDIGEVLGGGISPLERLKHNVSLNKLDDVVDVRDLNWFDATKQADDRPDIWRKMTEDPPNMIFAADVIYDPDLIPPLVATLHVLLCPIASKRPRQAIIAATVRNETTLELFVEICNSLELEVVTLHLQPIDHSKPTFWDSGLDVSVPVRIMRISPRMQYS